MLIIDLHNVNYAVARMDKRFAIYKFIEDNHLYPVFVKWSKDHPIQSRYKRMYCFIVSLHREEELKDPRYDRRHPLNVHLVKNGQFSYVDQPSEVYFRDAKTDWIGNELH